MRAVILNGRGGVEVLAVAEVPSPEPGPGEVRVRVRASALNRADTLQRMGVINPPPSESQILGVEIAGEVDACGEGVTELKPGQRVCGLVPGGGYAEHCVMDAGQAVLIPEGWSFVDAAAVPEACYTANETLFRLGELEFGAPGQSVLVHAGSSGMGSVIIQLAKLGGITVVTTVGSPEKAERCRQLGADHTILYRQEDFVAATLRVTDGAGVDVVEDFIGAPYLMRNLAVLKPGGRLIQIGVMGGLDTQINLEPLMLRRLQIKGTVIRSLSKEAKRAIVERFRQRCLPLLVAGKLKPVVDSTYPLAQVADAHRAMEASRHFGKIILTLD